MMQRNAECPFCLEKLADDALIIHSGQFGDHVACKACLRQWVEAFFRQHWSLEEPKCPICRQNVDEVVRDTCFFLCPKCKELVPRFYLSEDLSSCGDCEHIQIVTHEN